MTGGYPVEFEIIYSGKTLLKFIAGLQSYACGSFTVTRPPSGVERFAKNGTDKYLRVKVTPLCSKANWSYTIGCPQDTECDGGMDVSFVVDYTGSMGGYIDSVKANIQNIYTTIVQESAGSLSRVSYCIFDEYRNIDVPPYTQRICNGKFLTLWQKIQTANTLKPGSRIFNPIANFTSLLITGMSEFDEIKYDFVNKKYIAPNFDDAVKVSNTLFSSTTDVCNYFPLGYGANYAEPSDVALENVMKGKLVGSWRDTVFKVIILITDAPPGGYYDGPNYETVNRLLSVLQYCKDNFIKVVIMGLVDITKNTAIVGLGDPNGIFYQIAKETGGVLARISQVSLVQKFIADLCDGDNIITVPCDTTQNSGGRGIDVRNVNLGSTAGDVTFAYNSKGVADRFKLILDGVQIFDSGYVGNPTVKSCVPVTGPENGSFVFYKNASPTSVQVIVESPCTDNSWQWRMSCVEPSKSRTSTPTPSYSESPTPTPTSTPTPTGCIYEPITIKADYDGINCAKGHRCNDAQFNMFINGQNIGVVDLNNVTPPVQKYNSFNLTAGQINTLSSIDPKGNLNFNFFCAYNCHNNCPGTCDYTYDPVTGSWSLFNSSGENATCKCFSPQKLSKIYNIYGLTFYSTPPVAYVNKRNWCNGSSITTYPSDQVDGCHNDTIYVQIIGDVSKKVYHKGCYSRDFVINICNTDIPDESKPPTPSPSNSASPTPSPTNSPTPSRTPMPSLTPSPSVPDGRLFLWGLNNNGQCGQYNTVISFSSPMQIYGGGNTWQLISADAALSTATKGDGTFWSWGFDSIGRFGTNTTRRYASSPIQTTASPNDQWAKVDTGRGNLSAVIKKDGTLWMWGGNTEGGFGYGTATNYISPIRVTTSSNWHQVCTGDGCIAALANTGDVYTWGTNNVFYQLGVGDTNHRSSPILISSDANYISMSYRHGALIKTDGTLWLWGSNTAGQLGIDSTNSAPYPTQEITFENDWKNVTCGLEHTCAIKLDGSLWCWGNGLEGRIGTGGTNPTSSPIQTLIKGNDWIYVAAGDYNTVALKTNFSLWVWGLNDYGQIADPKIYGRNVLAPLEVFSVDQRWYRAAYGAKHIMAIENSDPTPSPTASVTPSPTPSNSPTITPSPTMTPTMTPTPTPVKGYQLWSWGGNRHGSLGLGDKIHRSSPTVVDANEVWIMLGGGGDFSLSLRNDFSLWSWGWNYSGTLGLGDKIHRSSPVRIGIENNWAKIDGGGWSGMSIKKDGTFWSWGYNSNGELGLGDVIHRSSPEQIGTSNDWDTFVSDFLSTTALKKDGSIWTWGSNSYRGIFSGFLGTNDILSRSIPTRIGSENTWRKIGGSGLNKWAIKNDGTLWGWGYGIYGVFGSPAPGISSPVQFGIENNWEQVDAASSYFSAGIKTDGTLWMWGYNSSGELGQNYTSAGNFLSSPLQVGIGTDWMKISCSVDSIFALKNDGSLWSWGFNGYGELGLGDILNRSSPVRVGNNTIWYDCKGNNHHVLALKEVDKPSPSPTLSPTPTPSRSPIATRSPTPTPSFSATPTPSPTDSPSPTPSPSGTEPTPTPTTTPSPSPTGVVGNLFGMGKNTVGQLGDNTTKDSFIPVNNVVPGNNWDVVSGNSKFGAAIRTDNTLWMWGENSYGKLGNITSVTSRSSAVQVLASDGQNLWKKVSCGTNHAAAIRHDGSMWTWGSNTFGELGRYTSTTTQRIVPNRTVDAEFEWSEVSCGDYFTSGIKNDGTLWSFGINSTGQLGRGFIATPGEAGAYYRSSPIQVYGGGFTWSKVSCGGGFAGAIKKDGTLWLWGDNSYGKLGDDTTVAKSSPVQTFYKDSKWQAIKAGENSFAAIKQDGSLWVWGSNKNGSLGDGTTMHRSQPVQINGGGNDWRLVALHSNPGGAAIKNDGTTWQWGTVFGKVFSRSPVQITQGYKWLLYDEGDDFFVAVGGPHPTPSPTALNEPTPTPLPNGYLYLWGNNDKGQLGSNDNLNYNYPNEIYGDTDKWTTGLDAGYEHFGAVKKDGTLWLVGDNEFGELGDNSIIHRSSPVQTVAGTIKWYTVSAGKYHSSALTREIVATTTPSPSPSPTPTPTPSAEIFFSCGFLYPANTWSFGSVGITSTGNQVYQSNIKDYSPLCINPAYVNRGNSINFGKDPGFYQLNFDKDIAEIKFLVTGGGFANAIEVETYTFTPDKNKINLHLDYEFGTTVFENTLTTGLDVCPSARVGCGALVTVSGFFSSLRIDWPYTGFSGIKLSICSITPV